MEDRETAQMREYGESKMTRIMMATVPHVTSGLGLREFQADGFLLTRVYLKVHQNYKHYLRLLIYVIWMLYNCKANEEQDARSGNSYVSKYTNSFNLYTLLTKHMLNLFSFQVLTVHHYSQSLLLSD